MTNVEDITMFGLAGFTLNTEEQTALKASLTIKRDQEKVSNILFWGKVFGIQKDYYLAQTRHKDLFGTRFYYRFFKLKQHGHVKLASTSGREH
jgi:hypothetical protein